MPEQNQDQFHQQSQAQEKPERRSAWLDKNHGSQQDDVIHVLRTTQQHHVRLGMIADQKANIILGAFLIFITVTQSVLENHEQYDSSMWILLVFFTLSAISALLVIAPRFRSLNPRSGRPSNLLFLVIFLQWSRMNLLIH